MEAAGAFAGVGTGADSCGVAALTEAVEDIERVTTNASGGKDGVALVRRGKTEWQYCCPGSGGLKWKGE
jgi:hypothetical protein